MGSFPTSRHTEGPSAFRPPRPALTKIFKPIVRVGAGPLWEQGPTKASLSCSTKHHFWVSEVADPGPTPFLLPWATARREAGRPISSPPLLVPGRLFQRKEVSNLYFSSRKPSPSGVPDPLGDTGSLWHWAPCPPSPVAREPRGFVFLRVYKEKQVNRNQATLLINISRDSAGMGASGT